MKSLMKALRYPNEIANENNGHWNENVAVALPTSYEKS
jgi:hypothetical protein